MNLFIKQLSDNVHFAARLLVKKTGFTLATTVTLALGIGVNTVMFSIFNSTVLQVPYKHPSQLAVLWASDPKEGIDRSLVSKPDFDAFRHDAPAFEGMALHSSFTPVVMINGQPDRVIGAEVSTDYFIVLGVSPAVGRGFLPEDSGPVALISQKFWQQRFHSDEHIIGNSLIVDSKVFSIIGVLPDNSDPFQYTAAFWVPLTLQKRDNDHGARRFAAIARLKPKVPMEEAQQQLEVVARRLENSFSDTNKNWTAKVTGLRQYLMKDIQSALLVLSLAVVLVLLIACANVANLLLAFMTSRQKEFAVRTALGSPRRWLAAQLLIESLLLAGLGGALGFLLAFFATRTVAALAPKGVLPAQVTLDSTVLGFTAALTILTGLLCFVVPAVRISKFDINETLKETGSTGSRGLRHHRIYRTFVVAQIGLSLALIIGAGLMIKSFWQLQAINPGFNLDNVLTARIVLSPAEYHDKTQQGQFFTQLLERLSRLPGVTSAAAVTALPLGGAKMSFSFNIQGQVESQNLLAQYSAISPRYFQTLGIPLVAGRSFDERDHAQGPDVIIINKFMADKLFPGESAIGKRIQINYGKPVFREVIGVVEDVKHVSLDEPTRLEMYVPYLQNPWGFMTIAVRSELPPTSLIQSLRHEVFTLNPGQPVENIASMRSIVESSIARPRFSVVLIALFACFAAVLAAVGVYGVTAYAVSQRVREIGIRMTLGATRGQILRFFLREDLMSISLGTTLGLCVFFIGTKVLISFLPKLTISWADGGIIIASLILLAFVAMSASYLAANRATKLEPVTIIRNE